MKKFKIGIDMDDTTFDLGSRWRQWINETYGDNVEEKDIRGWNIHEFCPKAGSKVYEYLALPGIFTDLDPYPNAISTINKLKKEGHEIIFITSSPPQAGERGKDEKSSCLKKHFKWFKREEHVRFSHNKTEEKDLDILFDDRARWLFEFDGIAVAMDHQWNRHYTGGYRVRNWNEFYELISRLSEYMK